MDIEKYLRKMARSNYWQRIYRSSKKLNNISLFENSNNFSGIQALFLYWLEVYDALYSDICTKEYDILDEEIINDDIRCDAFIYWRKKQIDKENVKNKNESKTHKPRKKGSTKGQDFPIFQGSKESDKGGTK